MEWLKEFASDDIGKAILTVAGTLLVTAFGAFLGGFKDILLDWWRRRGTVRYNAMLLSTTLEQFLSDCLTVIWDDGYPDPEGTVRPGVSRPKNLEWPKELSWPLINSEIMFRCLMIPAEIKSAEESISFVVEHIAGPPDYDEFFDEVQKRYSELGLQAHHILKRIQDDYGVPLQDRRDIKPFDEFNKKIEEIDKRVAEREAGQAKFMEEMEQRRKDREASGSPLTILVDTAVPSVDR